MLAALRRVFTPLADTIDVVNDAIGRWIAWLSVAMVIGQFILVVLRYTFGIGSILGQEAVLFAHGTLFMVAAAYALRHDAHVRVDVFYRRAGPRTKALVDLIGAILLLLPVCIVLWLVAWPYVTASWAILEGSRETSGLPAVFLQKSMILVFAGLLGVQGLSLVLRNLLRLAGARL